MQTRMRWILGTGSTEGKGMRFISIELHVPKLTPSGNQCQVSIQRCSNFTWCLNSEQKSTEMYHHHMKQAYFSKLLSKSINMLKNIDPMTLHYNHTYNRWLVKNSLEVKRTLPKTPWSISLEIKSPVIHIQSRTKINSDNSGLAATTQRWLHETVKGASHVPKALRNINWDAGN